MRKLMSNELLELWHNFTADKLYNNWRGGIVEGLLFKQSLYDATPLHEFI